MSAARNRYVLGQEVTSAARAKTRAETVVLSVRLTTEEMAAVEAASRATGRAVSQVVREAIKGYLYFGTTSGGYSIAVSGPFGTTTTGQVWHSGKATPSSVELSVA
ncbi:MAG: CopG family transcriptional regulator [Chloroflexi bacterium]|nr:CopG family transcriptional regulator [Chloroflexota bacterium]